MNMRIAKHTTFVQMLCALLLLLCPVSLASAGWLIYSKPAFHGRVVDLKTKEPIEGAVVVALYKRDPIVSGPAGGGPWVIHAKETLTDEKGEFHIPRYLTIIQPFAKEGQTSFVIYKAGYSSYPSWAGNPPPFVRSDLFFSKELGAKGEVHLDSGVVPFTYGIVELLPLATKEERLRAIPSTHPAPGTKELPLLLKAINEEGRRYGLGEVR